jgi:hypothetical protein
MFVMVLRQLNPRNQGAMGEAAAIAWFTLHGYCVWVPLGHSSNYDLLVVQDEQLHRVQVKTATFVDKRRFVVQLSTSGGNQSWNGTIKFFDRSRCDLLFVLVADGRQWVIPSSAVEGRRSIVVGGPKYAAFEVERVPGFEARTAPPEVAELDCATSRRDSGAVKRDAL